ncbi:MAG: aminotransferase class III-fold pyridoxal phosphate-dependent enzyme, partial [Candidatus Korarchaeota archaeon]|nr:aminotransferase class III-fold pyridoxal phosphate-dependent enzyme [Candidatus Korarchaeota archaeon]NIU85519.1 aminotransferase class III-fold pyridoxal phosphate-dependent enzyme [Candidatus Thorarchaeota archaeon]NIW53567.1 aminotransferase class III-fold pyridoxal phosphate-dependent enzyme [Candidatus Korarchaeota archaeon]
MKKEILKAYVARTPKSKMMWEETKEVIPSGVGSAWWYFEPYPFFVSKAKGSRIWDADGNEYIDYLMGYGINVTGHAHPTIANAV